MTKRWAIRSVLVALMLTGLVRPSAAEVTVCFTDVRLDKSDKKPEEEKTVNLLDSSLKQLLRDEVTQLHTVLTTAKKRLPDPPIPLNFDQAAGCTGLTLVISTTGTNVNAQVLYKEKELGKLDGFTTEWRFTEGSDPQKLRTLLYQAITTVSTKLTDIDNELLKRLVKDESERIKLSALKMTTPTWCNTDLNCAVLPKLTLNEYLFRSSFLLDVELEGEPLERSVESKGSGQCAPYSGTDTKNLGIIVTHQKSEWLARPWSHVSFSLKEVTLLPKGASCGQSEVKAPINQPPPRGAR
jgi:hypothetical protein